MNKKALLIEGLFSYRLGFVREVFKKPLEEMGFEVESIPWTDAKKYVTRSQMLIIAHSFGAGYALQYKLPCDLLVTLDARRWDAWNNSKLVAPYPHTLNFFQTSGLRGYKIEGATNANMGRVGHTRLPKACKEPVINFTSQLLRKE
jgi:hypothetical protein